MKAVLTSYRNYAASADRMLLLFALVSCLGFCAKRPNLTYAPTSDTGAINTSLDSAFVSLEQTMLQTDSVFRATYMQCKRELLRGRIIVLPDAVLDTSIVKRTQ